MCIGFIAGYHTNCMPVNCNISEIINVYRTYSKNTISISLGMAMWYVYVAGNVYKLLYSCTKQNLYDPENVIY